MLMQEHTSSGRAPWIREKRSGCCNVWQIVQASQGIWPDIGQRQRGIPVLQAHVVLSQ